MSIRKKTPVELLPVAGNVTSPPTIVSHKLSDVLKMMTISQPGLSHTPTLLFNHTALSSYSTEAIGMPGMKRPMSPSPARSSTSSDRLTRRTYSDPETFNPPRCGRNGCSPCQMAESTVVLKSENCSDIGIKLTKNEVAASDLLTDYFLTKGDGAGGTYTIPFDNLIVRLVVNYMKAHEPMEDTNTPKDNAEFDKEFLQKINEMNYNIFDVLRAADFLIIPSLVELTCRSIADGLQGLSIQEMRNKLGISELTVGCKKPSCTGMPGCSTNK